MALEIIESGIKSVLPAKVMNSVRYDKERKTLFIQGDAYPLSRGRIFVIGAGKASGLMAKKLEAMLGKDNITDGIVICNNRQIRGGKIKIVEAGHPFPDQRGIEGVRSIMGLKQKYSINANDLILCLISGGGSALMPCPVAGVTLEEKRKTTELLISSGANIDEINVVRKHLSGVKGGRLGAFFAPAKVVSLVLSDVIGNRLSTIASGPTCPDPSTFGDAYGILKRHHLIESTPRSVLNLLNDGCRGSAAETPKSLDNVHNYVIGDINLALKAMSRKARSLGFHPCIISAEQQGNTEVVARVRAREILGSRYAPYDVLLIGGETTPSLPADAGRGGRNQHYAAATLAEMKGYPGEWLIASVGTDGSDFLSGVAGAIVDSDSLSQIMRQGIDIEPYLKRYDSYTLLSQLNNSIIVTGDTGTNVGDVILYMLKQSQPQ